jgi:ABC-2 type transport system permease protein
MSTTTTLTPAVPTSSHRPDRSDLRLALRQVGFEQRAFWRNRSGAFFSVGLPLMFLVVFNALNGSHTIEEMGGIGYSTWFVPGILAYGIMMATFTNLATSITVARDSGVLKRLHGTPLPNWVYLAGRIGSTAITVAVLVVATLGLGVAAYGVEIRVPTLPGLALTLLAGTVCFTVLGLAVTALIPRAESASAIANLLLLPVTFASGIWMVIADPPRWLDLVAGALPVRAFAHGLQYAFHPASPAPGIVGRDLAVLVIWAVIGVVAFRRWFRWEARH